MTLEALSQAPLKTERGQRIVHVIAEFSGYEAMGRTVLETVARIPGEHHLITTHAHDNHDAFASVTELGGKVATFPMGRSAALGTTLDELDPDLVHFHAGALAPVVAAATELRNHSLVVTMYAWPNMPSISDIRRVGFKSARTSNALRARVAVTSLLPTSVAVAALRRAGVKTVLTPDPRVMDKLKGHAGLNVVQLESGAPEDSRRAHFECGNPVVLFAGRAEKVRGIPTVIEGFAKALPKVPGAKLRLLLIPRPELAEIVKLARTLIPAESLEIVIDPVPDLIGEMANAQVGAWPFELDYVTSPPAMALAEAMSVGLPTISTPVACVRSVVEPGVSGLTIRPGDSAAMARNLVDLMTNVATWKRFSTGGRVSISTRFGWDRAAATTAAAYASTVCA